MTDNKLQKRFTLPSTYAAPPPGYISPQWPSLYGLNAPGIYLYLPSTIWEFTLYWTLLLEGIVFIGCGLVASYTFWRSGMRKREEGESMAPAGKKGRIRVGSQVECSEEWIPLNQSGRRRGSSIITTIERHPVQKNHPSHTKNIHHHSTTTLSSSPRPLLASLFLIPTIFFLSYAFAALISGSLVGWAIAALYNAAFLRMSTWVPALWSAALSLILIISSYSNISTVL